MLGWRMCPFPMGADERRRGPRLDCQSEARAASARRREGARAAGGALFVISRSRDLRNAVYPFELGRVSPDASQKRESRRPATRSAALARVGDWRFSSIP